MIDSSLHYSPSLMFITLYQLSHLKVGLWRVVQIALSDTKERWLRTAESTGPSFQRMSAVSLFRNLFHFFSALIWRRYKDEDTFDDCKGACQKRFSGFFPLRGYPPPTPLTENHFAKKPLAERGGTAPPLTENCRKFSSKNGSKRAKIGVFWPKIAVF